ncbi:MAG: hypothetical protein GY953_34050, partial [bacterium]|nr:hypothetical protein [bacterium]
GEMHTSDADLHDFVILAYYTGARRRSIENLPIPAHPATYSGDIRPLIPEYPATWARHRWVMSLMSAFGPFVKHGAGRPGSPQEGPARGAK